MERSIYEISYSHNDALRAVAEQHTDEERADVADPFDILAAKEEEEGCPLVYQY